MNERIRELYQQAHSIRHYDGDPALDGNPPTVYWQGEVSAQRFAKMIVRDCVAKIEEAAESSPELYGVSLEILEHFDMELDNE